MTEPPREDCESYLGGEGWGQVQNAGGVGVDIQGEMRQLEAGMWVSGQEATGRSEQRGGQREEGCG